jgi:hypothetical protein
VAVCISGVSGYLLEYCTPCSSAVGYLSSPVQQPNVKGPQFPKKGEHMMKPTDLLKRNEILPMIANDTLTHDSPPTAGQEPINRQRRNLIGGALAALLASSVRVLADDDDRGPVNNPFIVLLHGIYEPAELPDLGLSGVNLSDTSYIKTKIYPIFGVPGSQDQDHAIGEFYVSFSNPVCVYDLPGGAIAMSFNDGPKIQPIGFNTFVPFPDGQGGNYLEGTFELAILDAIGVYKSFKGGHNHMVDRLHNLASGQFNEFCFCNISQYQFP